MAATLLLLLSALPAEAGKAPPIEPYIAPVDIPTPRIYPKTNATGDVPSTVNMTSMNAAQRALLVNKTITQATAMVANVINPPPSPQVILSSTPASAAAPTPAVDPQAVGKTAVSVEMRVSGDGVTPFGPANQQRLINVFADVARNNLTQDQFRIVLVSDAYTSRRRLMDNKGTPLTNVADVMMEVDAGTAANAPIVAAEISSILTNDTLAISLQQHGLAMWSVKLLSISIVAPSKAVTTLPCQQPWSRWCLDGTPLTPTTIYLIIAVGSALVIFLIFAVIVYRETGELEYPKEEQSFTLRQRLQHFVTGRVVPSSSGKGATASGSKGVPSGSH
ncbi:g10881 [Coccomyxa elongata]